MLSNLRFAPFATLIVCLLAVLTIVSGAGASAAYDLDIRSMRQPVTMSLSLPDIAVVVDRDNDQRAEARQWLAQQISHEAADHPGRLLLLSLTGGSLRYDGLSDQARQDLSDQFPQAAASYEAEMAAFLSEVIDEVNQTRGNVPLSVVGLPIEPDRVSIQQAQLSNERYQPVIDQLAAFTSVRSFIIFNSGLTETETVHQRLPEALRLSEGRPLVFRTNGQWRIAMPAAAEEDEMADSLVDEEADITTERETAPADSASDSQSSSDSSDSSSLNPIQAANVMASDGDGDFVSDQPKETNETDGDGADSAPASDSETSGTSAGGGGGASSSGGPIHSGSRNTMRGGGGGTVQDAEESRSQQQASSAPDGEIGEFLNAPSTYVLGSTEHVIFTFTPAGLLAGAETVIFQVYTPETHQVQAQYRDGGNRTTYPGQILDTVTPGTHEVQAIVLDGSEDYIDTVSHTVTFVESGSVDPADDSHDEPTDHSAPGEPGHDGADDGAGGNDGGNDGSDGGDHSDGSGGDDGNDGGDGNDGDDGDGGNDGGGQEVSYGAFVDLPDQYVLGSSQDILFVVSPDGYDAGADHIVFQTWSSETNGVEAPIADYSEPFIYPGELLDTVTPGNGHVQALIRDENNTVLETVSHAVLFVDDPDGGNDGGGGGNDGNDDPADGWSPSDEVDDDADDPDTGNPDGSDDDADNNDGSGGGGGNGGDDGSDDGAGGGGDDGDGGGGGDDGDGGGGDGGGYDGPTYGGIHEFTGLPVDEDGWTVFTPSNDTKIIYVSSSQGSDLNDGLSPEYPVKSLAEAYSRLRHGYPDWMLLKRGDVWTNEQLSNGSGGRWQKSGPSKTERMVIGSYGDHPNRPLVRTGVNQAFRLNAGSGTPENVDNLAIVGIHVHAHTYTGSGDQPSGFNMSMESKNILIEDCFIEGYRINLRFQNGMSDVALRRNFIVDAYSTSSSHAHGIFTDSTTRNFLYEENVFDRNGWNPDVPGADKSTHHRNLYSQTPVVTFARNFSNDSSSNAVQFRWNVPVAGGERRVFCYHNVFARNPTGVFVDGKSHDTQDSYVEVVGNWISEANDISESNLRGWGLSLGNIYEGIAVENIVSKKLSTSPGRGIDLGRVSESMLVKGNVMYDWLRGIQFSGEQDSYDQWGNPRFNNITLEGNEVQLNTGGRVVMHSDDDDTMDAIVASTENRLFTTETTSEWISVEVGQIPLSTWKSNVGDTTSTAVELPYTDPERTLATYHGWLGQTPTYEAFMAALRQQQKGSGIGEPAAEGAWNPDYMAVSVINYVRAGFDMEPLSFD